MNKKREQKIDSYSYIYIYTDRVRERERELKKKRMKGAVKASKFVSAGEEVVLANDLKAATTKLQVLRV